MSLLQFNPQTGAFEQAPERANRSKTVWTFDGTLDPSKVFYDSESQRLFASKDSTWHSERFGTAICQRCDEAKALTFMGAIHKAWTTKQAVEVSF